MPDLPQWWDWITVAAALTVIHFYQRSRWGIRIMTRHTMRAQMEKEIEDTLWAKVEAGKLSVRECSRINNILADIFDMPNLRCRKHIVPALKAKIKERLRKLKKTPKPNIPGEKPIQEPRKPITKRSKVTHIKFNSAV